MTLGHQGCVFPFLCSFLCVLRAHWPLTRPNCVICLEPSHWKPPEAWTSSSGRKTSGLASSPEVTGHSGKACVCSAARPCSNASGRSLTVFLLPSSELQGGPGHRNRSTKPVAQRRLEDPSQLSTHTDFLCGFKTAKEKRHYHEAWVCLHG